MNKITLVLLVLLECKIAKSQSHISMLTHYRASESDVEMFIQIMTLCLK